MPRLSRYRPLLIGVLLLFAGGVAYFLFGTEAGQHFTHQDYAQQMVQHHPIMVPILFIACYVLMSVLMLPVLWLQLLAGYCYGLVFGTVVSEVSAVAGATLALCTSRYLAAEWFHTSIESHIARLRAIDEKLGSNGLLVVMAVRLVHVMPFGASNYVFGLTTIRYRDAALGTLLGGLPAISFYVATGAGLAPWSHARLLAGLVVINIALLGPVIYRFYRLR